MSSSTSNNDNQNINPRPCVDGCGIQIYWNTTVNEYWEVFTKKKHVCPNRGNKSSGTTTTTLTADGITPPSNSPRPHYYNPHARKRTPYASFSGQQQPKPKMSNSFELLTGPIETVQTKYEIISDLVTEHGGKTHGSQSHIGPNNSTISLIVYYEVPLGQREEVKKKFENCC